MGNWQCLICGANEPKEKAPQRAYKSFWIDSVHQPGQLSVHHQLEVFQIDTAHQQVSEHHQLQVFQIDSVQQPYQSSEQRKAESFRIDSVHQPQQLSDKRQPELFPIDSVHQPHQLSQRQQPELFTIDSAHQSHQRSDQHQPIEGLLPIESVQSSAPQSLCPISEKTKNYLGCDFHVTHSCTRGLVAKGLGCWTGLKSKWQFERPRMLTDFYEIHETSVIGEGGFGTCFSGRFNFSGELTRVVVDLPCIVKCVPLAKAPKPYVEMCAVGKDECLWGKLLEKTNHPSNLNVVRYLDFLFHPDFAYVVMESLSGPELLTYLEEEAPVTESFCRDKTRQLLSALEYVHTSIGLIHRDVKLDNLRFRTSDPASDLVLLDFGLSCFTQSESGTQQDIVGTLFYVAPEIFSRKYTTQVDLWSAGVCLFVMLTGRLPWKMKPGQGFYLNKEIVSGRAVESALKSCAGLPPMAVELVRGLLDLSPDRRLTATAALAQKWFDPSTSTNSSVHLHVLSHMYARVRLETTAFAMRSKNVDASQICLNLKNVLVELVQTCGSLVRSEESAAL